MRTWLTIEVRRGGRVVDQRSFDSCARRFVKIGTMPTADILLDEPRASRLHAMIEMRGNGMEIRDLGTVIGTKVNGSPITCMTLGDGDRVTIGDTSLLITIQTAAATAIPPPVQGPAWLAELAALPEHCQQDLQLFFEFLRFRERGTLPAATEPTPIEVTRVDASRPDPSEPFWRPASDAARALQAVTAMEKYDTRRLVAQMRRERRRTSAGAAIAVVVSLAAVGLLSTLSRAVGFDAGAPARSAASLVTSTAPVIGTPMEDLVAAEVAELETHTVERGDTLSAIAMRYLGDMRYASLIFAANRDTLTDPSQIEVGMTLRIPATPGGSAGRESSPPGHD